MTCPCNGTGAIDHGDSLEICGCPAPTDQHDYEFGALARYLDAHPGRHAQLMRHDGKWVIRCMTVLGFGHSLGEASANVCNALMSAQPEAGSGGAR